MRNTDMFSLKGKKAFITGGASGIGKVVAKGFANAGADIAIVDINLDLAEETVQELNAEFGTDCFAIKADVTDTHDAARLQETLKAKFKTLDIALNNAGICKHAPAESMSYEDWRQVIDINLTGVFLTAQVAAQIMIPQKRGSIINTASMSAHIVNFPQQQCAYNASKAGVVHLTKSFAVEWAKYNIRVNSISPGYIQTPLTHVLPDEWKNAWMQQSVTKRFGTPEDLVAAMIYLASDHSLFTTGTDLTIDGGFTCV